MTPVFGKAELNYVKNYIAIAVNGNNYFWLHKRSGSKSLLGFWVAERLIGAAKPLLDAKGITHTVRKNQTIRVTTDKKLLEDNADLFRKLAELVQRAWAG